MLFSIIIPMKNGEEFIDRAVKSVLVQTESDYEIIIVNDHSTDNSMEIATLYSAKYSNINCYNSKFEGVSCARNLGIEYSRGDYVIFLDVDDLLTSEALSLFREVIEAVQTDIVSSGYRRVDSEQKTLKNFKNKYIEGNGKENIAQYLSKEAFTHLGAFAFNRKFLEKYRIRFIEKFSFAEDFVFVTQALYYANEIKSTGRETYLWTLRLGSALYTPNMNKFSVLKSIEYIKEFLKADSEYIQYERAISNQYAIHTLDTVLTLLWLGCDVGKVEMKINECVNFAYMRPFRRLMKGVRKEIFLLKNFRKFYLIKNKKTYVPYYFMNK